MGGKGSGGWNKGKKLGFIPKRAFKKGQPPWNKNLTKETDERVRINSINTSKGSKGRHNSPKTEFKKGCISLTKGKKYEELYKIEKIRKIKEKLRIARAKQVFPIKDTKIEVKIRNFLDILRIEYFQHKYMNIKHSYQCDFFIPFLNLVIECDGDYWHKYPVGREIDHIRTSELIAKGFKVLRLWEFEINGMNVNYFKNQITNFK